MASPSFGKHIVDAILAAVVGRAIATIKTEVEYAKQEVTAKLKALGVAAGLLVAAFGLFMVAFMLLLVAGFHALTYLWPIWLVACVLGGSVLLLGIIFAAVGSSKIKKNKDLMPERAINNIRAVFNK
ncbi:MAG: hypothetical protein CVT64_01040 [Actinobacteria bacterium HGW-Actinobacteria-4]|nr:MAG: hypothetical protein CVT64_01040 [Actinobacteria bacterium HGW-Actinobacteria-4]